MLLRRRRENRNPNNYRRVPNEQKRGNNAAVVTAVPVQARQVPVVTAVPVQNVQVVNARPVQVPASAPPLTTPPNES